MLVIANPYATTVSERLKSLVVYALQGRYDVHAVDTEGRDHATQLCRDAAADGYDIVVAFGGDGTVNEAANGLAGSATALTALPGGATNVYCRMLGIPNDVVDATEHLLAPPTTGARAGSTSGASTAATSCSPPASASTPPSCAASTPTRRRRRASATGTTRRRPCHVRARVRRAPAADRPRASAARRSRGVTALVQTGDPYTYFSGHPLHVADDIALDDGTIAGALLRRSRPYDVPTVLARLFSERRRVSKHRRVFEWHGARARALRLGRRPPDPAAGRRRLHRRHGRGALRGAAGRAHGPRLSAAGTVRVLRGGHLESVHRFAWRLHEPDGTTRAGGETGPVFLRSAAKPFQALPAVRAGVLERYGLDERHLAVACASHGGDDQHLTASPTSSLACGVSRGRARLRPARPARPERRRGAARAAAPHPPQLLGKARAGARAVPARGLAGRGLLRRGPPAPGRDARRDPRGDRRGARRRRDRGRRLRHADLRARASIVSPRRSPRSPAEAWAAAAPASRPRCPQ